MLNNFRPYLYPMFYKSIDKKTSQKKKSEGLQYKQTIFSSKLPKKLLLRNEE